MRKIIVGAFVSLDGVMQAPGGPDEDPVGGFEHGGWFVPHVDEEVGKTIGAMMAEPFDLLLGRKTYDIFAAHWPFVGADDPIGALFGPIAKYVATRNPDRRLDWRNSRTLGTDVTASLQALKGEDGPALLTQGSTELLKTLFSNDLVDEIKVWTAPVVIGKGKRLFGGAAAPAALKLVGSRPLGNGVVFSSYARSGPIQTGSFAMEPPTAAELERRRNLT